MSFFKVIDRPLRYTLQRRDGAHWQTAKAFTPERIEFRVLERMMQPRIGCIRARLLRALCSRARIRPLVR